LYSLEQVAWLIQALGAQRQCLLQSGDASGAIQAALMAVNLSTSCTQTEASDELLTIQYTSLEGLQQALEQSQSSKHQELEALRQLMGMQEPKSLTTKQKNNRRSLGFRLQKLERELNQ
jgi:hypothetical protein